jgi:hypothetical protein
LRAVRAVRAVRPMRAVRPVQAAQKCSSNIFLKNKRKLCLVDRSTPSRETLVQFVQISEVIDMKTEVLQALKGSLFGKKKTLHLV